MPGPVNYFYRDGNLPTGTKPFFIDHSILTIHGIIASNSLMFMNNVFRYPHTLPNYVTDTISRNVPSRILGGFTESNYEWFNSHNTSLYRNSIFFKGPLLYIEASLDEVFNIFSCQSAKAFKSQSKKTIMKLQIGTDVNDWAATRFPIFEISGLRRSERNANLN